MKAIEFIKKKVIDAGSQTAVARKTGVSQGTIAKIISGDSKPELGTIKKIADAYGLPLSFFTETAENANANIIKEQSVIYKDPFPRSGAHYPASADMIDIEKTLAALNEDQLYEVRGVLRKWLREQQK